MLLICALKVFWAETFEQQVKRPNNNMRILFFNILRYPKIKIAGWEIKQI